MKATVFGNPDAKGLCAICQDDLTGVEVLCTSTCHHWFCLECMANFLSNPIHPTDCICPLCRTLFRWCRCGDHTVSAKPPPRDLAPGQSNPNWSFHCHLGATNPRKGRYSMKEGRTLRHDDNWVTPGVMVRNTGGIGDYVRATTVRYTTVEIDYKRLPTILVSFGKFLALIALRPLDYLPPKLNRVISPWWTNINVFSSVTIGDFIDTLGNMLLTETVIAECRLPGFNHVGMPGVVELSGLVDFINDHLAEFFINFIDERDTDLPELEAGRTVTSDELRAAHLETPFYKIYFLLREFLRFGTVFINDRENQAAPKLIEVVPFKENMERALLRDLAPQMFLEALLQGVFAGM